MSLAQITAQLDTILTRDVTASTIAIHALTKQLWPDVVVQRGRQFTLRWCDSMLAMREALSDIELPGSTETGLVLLTPLVTHELAEDIAARLTRGRIYHPEGWAIVRQLFSANQIDGRLGHFSWMPQLLIDGAICGPYVPVANGFLDLDTAWKALLQRFLKLDSARPDATALLCWTMQPDANASLNLLPAKARSDTLNWLAESAGAVGKLVLACIEAGRTHDALALGLVCDVLYAVTGEGEPALGNATIRLERFVNDTHVDILEGRAWARTARQLLLLDDNAGVYRPALERADALLNDLRVAEFAYFSDVSPLGLDQRLRSFAAQLNQHVQAPTQSSLQSVERAADVTLAHVLAKSQNQRADKVDMARRLARWLLQPTSTTTNVADVVCWQADEGSFVDWARFRLLGGDELVEVSHAYEAVRTAVITRRNALARQFSVALQRWNAQPPDTDDRVIPLESVLERLVAPLAASNPVLLLVVDGLSTSIFRELFATIDRRGWTELVPAELARPLAGIAAFPTITEISRATLLCGKLTSGASSREKTGFSTHPALLAQSRAETPPRLFHKGDLSDATNLSSEVRTAIGNRKQAIVGIVYNAVDDHLSGPDQLNQRWSLDDLRLLLPILSEAREARRIVIITADHGHLLEDGSSLIPGGESDRWRLAERASNDNEIILAGGRVRTATGAQSVACLWSENSRYAGRKNGYHGGVTPQEVTVPMSVLVPSGMSIPGWHVALPAQPEWWDLPSEMLPAPSFQEPARLPRVAARRAAPMQGQAPLFELETMPTQILTSAALTNPAENWIDSLLHSALYASQRALAQRVAIPDDQMRKLLTAMGERGGKLSRAALAQRMAVPEMRLNGMLSAVRRVLNVDQSSVLVVDESAGTVELNKTLLLQQFRLEPQGEHR